MMLRRKIHANPRSLYGIPWWLEVRKETTPAHWAFGGFLCNFAIVAFGLLAGFLLMGIFGIMEYWNDWCDGTREGCADFWEAFWMFCMGFGIVCLFQCLSFIQIGWLHGGVIWS